MILQHEHDIHPTTTQQLKHHHMMLKHLQISWIKTFKHTKQQEITYQHQFHASSKIHTKNPKFQFS